MNTAGKQRFADTDWISTASNLMPLDRLPPVIKSSDVAERGHMMDAKFALQDGCDVQDTQMSDSAFARLFA